MKFKFKIEKKEINDPYLGKAFTNVLYNWRIVRIDSSGRYFRSRETRIGCSLSTEEYNNGGYLKSTIEAFLKTGQWKILT